MPGTIGSEFTVFYSGDDVLGFRDANGTYYDVLGNQTLGGNILLNGKARPVFEAPMNPDVRIKTVIDLGKPVRIRSLEIEVLKTTHPGAPNPGAKKPGARVPGAVGFNEVELQLRKR